MYTKAGRPSTAISSLQILLFSLHSRDHRSPISSHFSHTNVNALAQLPAAGISYSINITCSLILTAPLHVLRPCLGGSSPQSRLSTSNHPLSPS